MALSSEIYDFANSYVTFVTRGRGNTARIPIEASCRITDLAGSEEFFLIASCKGEDVYVERGLFKDPSYDWCGIFSEEVDYVLLRTFATYEARRAEERTISRISGDFDDVRISLRRLMDARALGCVDDIVRATVENRGLSGRTVIRDLARGVTATLEYPIKTMNVNQEDIMFQVDTGPVPFPDLARHTARRIELLCPAYIAYNDFGYAEFVLQGPTPVGQGLWVKHFSQIRGLSATNSIFCSSTA